MIILLYAFQSFTSVKVLNFDTQPQPDRSVLVQIGEDSHEQRLDNYLLKVCKGVPKSHIFRIIRSGEVRVNRKRADAKTRIFKGDVLRIPPIRTSSKPEWSFTGGVPLDNEVVTSALRRASSIPVVYEDEGLLVVSKPAGMAVHGGSGESFGVIESLRLARPDQAANLELVHRIDRETSGVLLISKKRSYLRKLQEQLRNRVWKKYYSTLVLGRWPDSLRDVDLPLKKVQAGEKEKKVFVAPDGDHAKSIFRVEKRFHSSMGEFSLMKVQILTGRTHQIRVHASASQFPIAGDDRYGNFKVNKNLAKHGLSRMFLHARSVTIRHPATEQPLTIESGLADDLQFFLDKLKRES